MKKLIIIRGNSGSGKSTVAKKIREKADCEKKIALVEQDYLRRFILKEKEKESENNVDLIRLNVIFALERGYDVILEGILFSQRYKNMLEEVMSKAGESYVYYLDIPFEETLRRHQTKCNAHDFGEKEMMSWYKENDVLGLQKEKVLNENLSEDEIVKLICAETGLLSS